MKHLLSTVVAVVACMMASLGPERYQHRLPFFAEVASRDEVRIDGYTQEIVDREIAFAKAADRHYWAFLLYGEESPMAQGLSLYLLSRHKAGIRFCAIGGAESARRLFDGFRESVQATGCGDPYIVAMNDTVSQGEAILNTIGADAISAYALAGDGRNAAPFTDLASRARSFWDEALEGGLAVVPLAMSGWDRRPRVEHPVAWERAWQQPMAALDRY